MLREIPGALATELRSLEWRGARGLEAAAAAASVTLAVLAALALHSDDPWWAGITAFQVTRASPSLAMSRAIMRLAGSIIGAFVGLLVLRLFVYQSAPFLLCLFLLGCAGLFGFETSRFGYAWLIGAVTACLVILMSFDQPQLAFTTAVNRVVDVMIGSVAFLVVCGLMPAPPAAAKPAAASLLDPPPLTVWRRGYGAELQRWLPRNKLMLVYACRGGLTVMLLPALAEWIAPISPVAIGITAVVVLSIPISANQQPDNRALVQRAVHRFVGCLIGALAGLACLAFVGDDFLLWIALMPPGIWLCSQIQTGTTGVAYVGMQAMFAYLMSLVQGQGPPVSIGPGLERLVGVMGGVSILVVVSLVLSLIPFSAPSSLPAARAGE
jgi:uncharacterized membrane protein YccC